MLDIRFSETGKMSKKKAVLIDDSKLARFALTKLLKEKGFKVEAFESAEDGLAYLENRGAHAIFMDHLMPGMDGLEATRAIHQNPTTADIPVVLCTSNDSDEHREMAMKAGALDLLPKPVDPRLLDKVLQQIDDAAAASPAPAAVPGLSVGEIESLVETRVDSFLHERLTDMQQELRALQGTVSSNAQIPPLDEESLLETADANATRIAHEILAAQATGVSQAAFERLSVRVAGMESEISERDAAAEPPVDMASVTAQATESARESAEKLVAEMLSSQTTGQTEAPEELEQRLSALSERVTEVANDFQASLAQSKTELIEGMQAESATDNPGGGSGELLSGLEDRISALENALAATTEAKGASAASESTDSIGLELKTGLSALEGKLKLYAGGAAAAGVLAALILRFIGG